MNLQSMRRLISFSCVFSHSAIHSCRWASRMMLALMNVRPLSLRKTSIFPLRAIIRSNAIMNASDVRSLNNSRCAAFVTKQTKTAIYALE